jgi:hypothetical protein
MVKKKVVKTGSTDQGIPGVPLDQGARLDGPRTGHEFEGHLRREVEEAKAEAAKVGWQKLANGLTIPADLVPAICTHCGMWLWVKPENVNGDCLCYHQSDAPAWKRRPATKAELAAWSKRQEEAQARREAEAPLRRAALDAYNRRLNQDDPATGKHFVDDPTRSVGRA